MKFRLEDLHTGYFIRRCMIHGWTITTHEKHAEIFDRALSDMGETVKAIYAALKSTQPQLRVTLVVKIVLIR